MTERRQFMLFLAILVSLVLHAILIFIAPRVTLLAASAEVPRSLASVDIALVNVPKPVVTREREMSPAETIESMAEHVELDPAPFELPAVPEQLDAPLDAPAPLPIPEPEADANPDAAFDDDIVAIQSDAVRAEIDVDRWEIAMQDTRVIADDATPMLRGVATPGLNVAMEIGAPGSLLDGPLFEPSIPIGEAMDPPGGLPALPEEDIIARAPVVQRLEADNDAEAMESFLQFELQTYSPDNSDSGFFRLRIVPKTGAELTPLPKDITFVIDASSSIVQRKLDLTARGLAESMDTLRPEDRFNIVAFRESTSVFRPEPVPATRENKEAAVAYLRELESHGETDVFSAMLPVVDMPVRPGLPGIVMLISDGRPTSGVKDGRAIINAVSAKNDSRHSIFAFAGGRTVNQYLLDLLTYRNRGESSVTSSIDAIDDQLPRFVEALRDPLLVDVHADFRSDALSEIYPHAAPDFYASRAFVMYGRYDTREDNHLALRVSGRAGDTNKEIIYRTPIDDAQRGGDDIARGWAFRKVYTIIDDMCRNGETPEQLAELRRLSSEYSIRTIYD